VPHERNYTDAQLREVAERGGVIGIYLSQSTMVQGGAFTLSDITEHIRHISDVAGEDAVALGTDFGGVLSGLPEGISSVGDIEKLWDALSAEGISQRQIEKIAYANAARYLCENLPE
jgi:membrane dipeptidase